MMGHDAETITIRRPAIGGKFIMDAIVKKLKEAGERKYLPKSKRPSKSEAEAAVTTLLKFIGEDVEREGLLDTPSRVAKAYDEMFGGYARRPDQSPWPHL